MSSKTENGSGGAAGTSEARHENGGADLLAEATAMTDYAAAYSADFIRRCASSDEGLAFDIKQILRKLKLFSVKEFERRIREERVRTISPQVITGWQAMLARGDKGGAIPNLANAMIALRHAPEWLGVLAANELTHSIEKLNVPPYETGKTGPWEDVDDIKTAEWLQVNGIGVKVNTAADAVRAIAEEHSFHPIRDYLKSLKWDRKKRISNFLTDYFGAEASDHVKLISARWLISAVARAMRPGCQVDTCLVLEGGQGIRKSTTLRALAGSDWFTDQIAEFDQKDASQDLTGKWIIEFSEIDKFSKHEQGVIKSFIPRQVDHYRPSFGRRSQDFPRQCVFAASTNKFTWAGDETGGRRWWPVRCSSELADIEGVRRDRDQIWAEAYAEFIKDTRWWFDETDGTTVLESLQEEQRARYDPDPWDDQVMGWVENDEEEFTANEAARAKEHHRAPEAYYVKTDSLLELCLKKPVGFWTQPDKNRVAKILTFHGFERFQRRVTTADGLPVYLDPETKKKPKREWPYRRVTRARSTSSGGGDSGDK